MPKTSDYEQPDNTRGTKPPTIIRVVFWTVVLLLLILALSLASWMIQ